MDARVMASGKTREPSDEDAGGGESSGDEEVREVTLMARIRASREDAARMEKFPAVALLRAKRGPELTNGSRRLQKKLGSHVALARRSAC